MITWKIAFTIYYGGQESFDYILRDTEHEHLSESQAAALLAAYWCRGFADPAVAERFEKDLLKQSYASLPDDPQTITDLGWERISPIIVTVRDGLVVGVTGLPVDVTVGVRDWDNAELDAQGESVPTVAEWTGPL